MTYYDEYIIPVLFTVVFAIVTIKIVLNSVKLYRKRKVYRNFLPIFIGLGFITWGLKMIYFAYNMNNNFVYVTARTVGYCHIFQYGKGVRLKYSYNGKEYFIDRIMEPLKEIVVPNGVYKVRIAVSSPEIGRVENNTR
ncbi:MAG: hypothetical protein HWD58_19450 [Bacteroidota bacterium]|nr:MAG: hypothetical protein HWD58_19450 [Bacteroidota bacterium]